MAAAQQSSAGVPPTPAPLVAEASAHPEPLPPPPPELIAIFKASDSSSPWCAALSASVDVVVTPDGVQSIPCLRAAKGGFSLGDDGSVVFSLTVAAEPLVFSGRDVAKIEYSSGGTLVLTTSDGASVVTFKPAPSLHPEKCLTGSRRLSQQELDSRLLGAVSDATDLGAWRAFCDYVTRIFAAYFAAQRPGDVDGGEVKRRGRKRGARGSRGVRGPAASGNASASDGEDDHDWDRKIPEEAIAHLPPEAFESFRRSLQVRSKDEREGLSRKEFRRKMLKLHLGVELASNGGLSVPGENDTAPETARSAASEPRSETDAAAASEAAHQHDRAVLDTVAPSASSSTVVTGSAPAVAPQSPSGSASPSPAAAPARARHSTRSHRAGAHAYAAAAPAFTGSASHQPYYPGPLAHGYRNFYPPPQLQPLAPHFFAAQSSHQGLMPMHMPTFFTMPPALPPTMSAMYNGSAPPPMPPMPQGTGSPHYVFVPMPLLMMPPPQHDADQPPQ